MVGGWLVVRAVTNHTKTFRFGMTGPYYVEIGQQPRISRKSAQFFLDWVDQRIGQLKIDDAAEQESVLRYQVCLAYLKARYLKGLHLQLLMSHFIQR